MFQRRKFVFHLNNDSALLFALCMKQSKNAATGLHRRPPPGSVPCGERTLCSETARNDECMAFAPSVGVVRQVQGIHAIYRVRAAHGAWRLGDFQCSRHPKSEHGTPSAWRLCRPRHVYRPESAHCALGSRCTPSVRRSRRSHKMLPAFEILFCSTVFVLVK